MVVDTSAIVAMLLDEPEAERFREAVVDAEVVLVSAATALECTLVLEGRYGGAGSTLLSDWIDEAGAELRPFDAAQLAVAQRVFRAYGKGRHPAGLNYGDCFSYALARVNGLPLLYKGGDFAQTDIEAVDEEAGG